MKTYLFYESESEEEFFVEAENVKKAKAKAKQYFKDPVFDCEVTEYEAEMLGLDTYQTRTRAP